MHQAKKGNRWYFGMKAHIGVDAESVLVHCVVGTAANVADFTQVDNLLHDDDDVAAPMRIIAVSKNAPSSFLRN
ncbi:hypothetical protein BGP83_18075 [Pseudomonas putida]|nr:hypothetical protein BGP83_18075 [Pseudomonas putida]